MRPEAHRRNKLGLRVSAILLSSFLLTVLITRRISDLRRTTEEWYAIHETDLPKLKPHASRPTVTCHDSCFKAKDGVCDEGRAWLPLDGGRSAAGAVTANTKPTAVECDLGTDCSDCGPFHGILPSGDDWDGHAGPVAFVRASNASLLVRPTTTRPAFLMPVTLDAADPDVSAMITHYGHREGGVTRAVHEMLSGACVAPDSDQRRLVIVVGANFGYYPLYAAMYGCRVIAWEPVPLFRAFLRYGAALNNVSHLITVRAAAVGPVPEALLTIGVPKHGTYWGLASVDNLNLHTHEVAATVEAPAERLDDIVDDDVLLMRVDVEGWEPEVVDSAATLLEEHRVANLLLEYSPGVMERRRSFAGMCALPRMLARLLDGGFRLGHMPTRVGAPWPPKEMASWYAEAMPLLEEVLPASVAYDIRACLWRNATEGSAPSVRGSGGGGGGRCAVPDRLRRFGVWNCGEWSFSVHPKGFRSSFGYNTNLWLQLRDGLNDLLPSPPLPANQAEASSTTTDAASGSRPEATTVGSAAGAAGGGGAPTTGLLRLEGVASLFDLDADMSSQWTSRKLPDQAVGVWPCRDVGQGHKVLFRCACSAGPEAAECRQQEAAVQALLAVKGMPHDMIEATALDELDASLLGVPAVGSLPPSLSVAKASDAGFSSVDAESGAATTASGASLTASAAVAARRRRRRRRLLSNES